MKYAFKSVLYKLVFSLIDSCGYCVFFLARFGRRKLPAEVKKILVIRLDHLGDVLYSTCVPANLKKKYGQAKVDFLAAARSKDLLLNNPYIDNLILYDAPWFNRKKKGLFSLKDFLKLAKELRNNNYDLGIDLRGDFRHILLMALSGIKFRVGYGITGGAFLLHRHPEYRRGVPALEHNLDLLKAMGMDADEKRPAVYPDASDNEQFRQLLEENGIAGGDSVIVIHSYAGSQAKNWIGERFSQLISMVYKKYNSRIILVGSAEDAQKNRRIISESNIAALDFAGKISMRVLFLLLKRANLFIGVDSAPAHMAAAAGTPVVVLYSGTNDAREWAPLGEKVAVITKGVDCSGCEKEECGRNLCMNLISVEDVMQKVEGVIKL
jgi:heptosyltransferase II